MIHATPPPAVVLKVVDQKTHATSVVVSTCLPRGNEEFTPCRAIRIKNATIYVRESDAVGKPTTVRNHR
jgi:hypothetical protein